MKKIISFLLTIALVFSLTACGGNGGIQNAESGAEAQNAANDGNAEAPLETPRIENGGETRETADGGGAKAPADVSPFRQVHLGDTISLDFVEFTLQAVDFGEKIQLSENHFFSPANKNNRFFWLSAVMTNLMGESFSVGSGIRAKLIFDGKYTYDGGAYSASARMAPLVEDTVFIYSEVPPAILERYQSVTFQFGFDENLKLEVGKAFADLDYLYELTYGRASGSYEESDAPESAESVETAPALTEANANVQESAPNASQTLYLGFGDTVKTNDYEFTLNKVKFSYDILPDDTSGYYHHFTPDSGNLYIDIDASIKNLMKRDIMIRELFTAEAVYGDGYTYNGSVAVVYDGSMFHYVGNYSAAAPLQTCHAHYMIQCPQEVENSLKSLYVVIHLADGNAYRYYIR